MLHVSQHASSCRASQAQCCVLAHKEDRGSLGLSRYDINPPLHVKYKCTGELKNNSTLLNCMEMKNNIFKSI